MALLPGTALGPYQITTPLGAGGMGEVYRARDTKLKREVALKVLPEIFVSDPQRLLRFEREAELLASLNHPNIAHIYGVVDEGGVRGLAMELVEGATLAERIAHGAMPLEETVLIGKQIAEGLEYAHDRGIIHRDLKPANVKVTPDGIAKILDFGLAKALAGEASETDMATSPTLSVAATTAGVLLGTAGYMSPEQARGKAVDRRADIWGFGCVLFEMLTGKPAFDGETVTDRLAAVVRGDPDLSQLAEKIPPRIRDLVKRCLIKNPKERLQAIGEARIVLDSWLGHPEEQATAAVGATAAGRKKLEWVVLAIALGSTLAAILMGTLYWGRAPEQARIVRASIQAGANSGFSFGGFAVSPDGKRLAYLASGPDGKTLLWIRSIDSFQAQPLAGTEGAGHPFWSPDSRFVGFFAGNKLKKIEASGGPPETLCDAPFGRGGTWNRDGVILFTPTFNTPLYRVDARGGTATEVTRLDTSKGETSHRYPYFLPDGRHFLYLAGSPYVPKENPTNSIMVGSLDSKESKPLFRTRSNAIYASDHILFLRLNTLMAQPFDAKRLELTGEALPIADHVGEIDLSVFGLFSASSSGVLAYTEGIGSQNRQLIWVDRSGRKVGEVPGADAYEDPQISPDGKRLSFALESGSRDVWIEDIARSARTKLTFGSASAQSDFSPTWSPDGLRIGYVSARGGKFGLYQRASDGSGNEEILLEPTEQPRGLDDWSRDGKYVAYDEFRQGVWAIWMLPLFGERKPYPFLQSAYWLRFSPDGKWAAYCSAETGRMEVYVVPFPGPGAKWQISTGGGVWPSWRRDGKEIFYLTPDNKLMTAEVKTTGLNFGVGRVSPLFETRFFRSFGRGLGYDATADGQRFIINYSVEQPSAAISLVVNWNAEAKK